MDGQDEQRDGRTERRTDDIGWRRTERRMDRDMNEHRWTDITGTQAQLKVFNWLCEILHLLAGRGQRGGAEGRETG